MSLRVPTSTYRVQLNPEFTFEQSDLIIPYLYDLGVGDLYASPTLMARPGSQHGYDVLDPTRLSGDLGGEDAFRGLCGALRSRRMGLLLDIVPNHMAASVLNPWWADLLENGRGSRYGRFFDVDWEPSIGKGGRNDKILLPVLGQIYGLAIEAGEIWIAVSENGFAVRYYDLEVPVSPRSYRRILGDCLTNFGEDEQVKSAAGELTELLAGEEHDEEWRGRVRRILTSLYRDHPSFRPAVEARLAEINGTKGDPASFVELEAILEEQPYRLAYWRRAADQINYRRFFDIADLVGVRVEEEEVFEERHKLVLRLISDGLVTGLRIDHVDGLFDPEEYLRRLQNAIAEQWQGDPRQLEFYVVVEKILAADEALPDSFTASGTSGYDYLNVLNHLFVEPAGLRRLDRLYREFTEESDFESIVYRSKKQVLDELFWGDVRRLGDQLIALARGDRYARDVDARQISRAMLEITARMGVYRTYTRGEAVRPEDRRNIERAVDRAQRTPLISKRALEFVRRVLLVQPLPYATSDRREWIDFVMRWQQFTGRVMAKGVEDTAFYNYNRLISMNEVGGEPSVDVSSSTQRFHACNQEAVARWPHRLNATSTHDTKRSEDVRARINVLSEIPDRWARAVDRWSRANARKKRKVNGVAVPDANEELLLYQTLIGMWPLDRAAERFLPQRIENFVIKSLREAKAHSLWTRPEEEYERACAEFAKMLVRRSRLGWFRDFERMQEYVAHFGAINALSQVVLKTMSPGVPDFYQGTEVWNFSLVDPDNRRPVDYERRTRILEELGRMQDPSPLLKKWPDGRIKLFVTWKLLQLRRRQSELFRDGDYTPLRASGVHGEHVIAFARRHEETSVIVAVPRFCTSLVSPPRFPVGRRVWKDTRLNVPAGTYTEVFTNRQVSSGDLGALFAVFPFAVLIR